MKMLALLAIMAVAVPCADAFAVPAARKVARKAPARADWTRRVAMTTEGGFLIGNPAAKAKLVEYGSLSCPYCQRFHQEAIAGLRARIATGDLSFEFRPLAVHSADPILHALLRCAGPARFTKFSDDFYAGQATLAAEYEKWVEANPTTNPNVTAADRIKFADQWGFTAFAMGHGLSRAQANACVANAEAIRLQQQREDKANRDFGVQGTPTFLLNDQKLAVYSWPDIDQAIAAALGS
ncbi:MAG: thioredoxin domain-containing protein [Proteobacteria bacterium]|nr:thioredoxin domain-containing protein [Pseudomonadota bacterium]